MRSRDGWWAALFLAPQVLGLLAFLVLPLGFAIALAFMKWDGLGEMSWVGFDNFAAQLSDPDFGTAVWNTVKLAVLTVPVGLALALLVAIALNNVRGKTFYRVVYFLPVVTSSVAVAVMWQVILASGDYGVLNSTVHDWFGITLPNWLDDPGWVIVAIAVVTVWSSLGLNVVIFLAGLQTIPPSLTEAARIDGAGPVRIFRSVTLPMISPTIFFSTVVAVISSFQAFDQIYVLVNPDHNDGARTIVYQVYDLGFKDFEFGMSSAAALILLALTLLVTLVQFGVQKRFVHYDS
ncbi:MULTISPECIES: carbohydrate ABC transporter permease [Streptosporangium]|uniref:Multiple sugar transport system permease protein n=1 Tax=Streptosporangium brasiliense TaxID=47480 RepID=A0ABT9R999_9ACTN|nr:sugar ABC transporter permease [Streptosporangium brasiliense]MDP9865818.1 multiple sugar transport system permease protein [Streptosporangium brasiliense]